MQKTFPLSKTEIQIIQQHTQRVQAAQSDLNAVYAIMLAKYDLPQATITAVDETGITVELPDEAPAPKADKP